MVEEGKIYLLLSDTGTVLTKLIKTYTKMPYNHASIAFDSKLREVYSFGRKMADNPFIGGFVKEDMNANLFQQATCAIYSLTVTGPQIKRMKRYIQAIEAQKEKYHYNLLGLFGVMFNKPMIRENSFFCSQFVATSLIKSGMMEPKRDPSLVKPGDLPNLADFELIYEGKLKDYLDGGLNEGTHCSYPSVLPI